MQRVKMNTNNKSHSRKNTKHLYSTVSLAIITVFLGGHITRPLVKGIE